MINNKNKINFSIVWLYFSTELVILTYRIISLSNFSHQDQREKNIQHDGRVRRDSDAEWEEWMRIRQEDEYAGLMTPKEKSWLRNIQAMQLQTDNPYQDDYYFIVSKKKKKSFCNFFNSRIIQ